MTILTVKLTPKTWIRAPLATKEQVKRYIDKGWLPKEAESLDRAFPRTSEGKAYIPKAWLEAALVRAASILGLEREVARSKWRIVEEANGLTLPKDYIEIDDQPLRYSRAIVGSPRQTVENFEYIDGTYTLSFKVEVEESEAPKFLQLLAVAGEIGLMSKTGKGYGKFRCEVKIEEKEERRRRKT
jgi:hypothetical protein